MSKQLINLAGGLAVLVILALGVLLVALPMVSQTTSADQQADEIAQTNDVYEIQVQTLREQEAKLTDLERDLAELRAEIPATALNDQVIELVGAAFEETGVRVESVIATEPESWSAPAGEGTETSSAATPPPAGAPAAPEDTAGGAEDATTDAAAPAPGSESAAEGALEAEQVVPFTIVVDAQDAAQATRFIDALRSATRLVRIEQAVLVEEEDVLRLTVTARSLVLAEK